MNTRRIVAIPVATLLLFVPLTQWPDEVAAQTCVQHNIYNGQSVVPWPQNAHVYWSADPDGTAGAGTGDPPPAWTFTSSGTSNFESDWQGGVGTWSLYDSSTVPGDGNGTNIRFLPNTEGLHRRQLDDNDCLAERLVFVLRQ